MMKLRTGRWRHAAALFYGGSAYLSALWLIGAAHWYLNLLGVLLLAHSLVIMAYFVHECIHNTVFAAATRNSRLAVVLCWFAGAGYGSYRDIRRKHLRHHVDRADIIAFNYRRALLRSRPLLRAVQGLEWAYVPAVDLFMHGMVLLLPFMHVRRRRQRTRIIFAVISRFIFFTLLALYSLQAIALYLAGYLIFLHVMRFMDVHQHTYMLLEDLDSAEHKALKLYDREFEERNTYSNPVSLRHPWLNLLTLNFGYHNAHHRKPGAAWYQLPALHQHYYGNDGAQPWSFAALLRSYHRHRVSRILNEDAVDTPIISSEPIVGVVGVSFLTGH